MPFDSDSSSSPTTMWRIMIDPEIGFLVKTATSDQAKDILSSRFKVSPNEIISCKPDQQAASPDKKDDDDWKKEELASTFDKPKFKFKPGGISDRPNAKDVFDPKKKSNPQEKW